jgi:integrase
VHPHRFRRDAGRRPVETTDLPTVAAWLGHERLDTVRIDDQPTMKPRSSGPPRRWSNADRWSADAAA